MNKIFCFGEILIRMSPAITGGWIQQRTIAAHVGGAEANVATALAAWAVPVKYGTAMPQNYLAKDIDAYLQGRGIDTTAIHYSGCRIGLYFMQQGTDLKHAGVFYDRAHSSFSDLKPGMIDWNAVLQDVSWFHFSAISPALNEDAVAVCKEALEAAAMKGIFISVDLNYRAKLWQYGKKPHDVMPELVQYCDLIMGNIWAANTLLGMPLREALLQSATKADYLKHAIHTAEDIQRQFPNCRLVANTFRFDAGHSGIQYYTTLYQDGQQYVSPEFTAESITDKAGSGDCFMAGLIYGYAHNHAPQDIINYAAAAAFGKLSETGDATRQSTADVYQTLKHYEQEAGID